ncbi:cytochrome P450 3A41-like isoform X1 [Haliotis cracherodii]|uniref:cytochrome P450 3A41-like isoform X1 n=2 Tax=Haliotis cracherodii TaxID=6455 RepID=UPI0039E74AFF
MEVFGLLDVPLWLLMLIGVLTLYSTYMSWHHGIFKKLGIDGPPPRPIVGNLMTILKSGMHGADLYWCQTYGKVVGIFMTRLPMLLISDDEMMKQIMVKDFNLFPNRQEIPKAMVGFPMDQSLVFSKDDHWRFIRNFMTPTFSAGKLKRMMPVIHRMSDRLVDLLTERAENKEEVEIKRFLEKYTMDVIAGTAFGMDVNALNHEDDPFVKNAKTILSNGLNSAYIVFITFFPFLIPLTSLLGYHLFPESNMNFFVKVTNKILEERKIDPSSSKYTDFIQLMVNADEEKRQTMQQNGGDTSSSNGQPAGLTRDEISAAALLFFIAGYDTTASTMSFCVYNIATHPEVQERLVAEIETVLGDQEPDYDSIQKLEYLEMCLSETLRLHPASVRVDRTCTKDMEVKGVKIPKGMTVGIPIYAIHHDSDRWDRPEEYDPERFSAENRSKHGPFDYLPFGNGPRNCIGMRLALVEAKITLIKLFKNFKFSSSSKTQIPLTFMPSALLRPAQGLWIRIEKR